MKIPLTIEEFSYSRATFVQSYKTFWVDVESDTMKGNETNPNTNVDWEVSLLLSKISFPSARNSVWFFSGDVRSH